MMNNTQNNYIQSKHKNTTQSTDHRVLRHLVVFSYFTKHTVVVLPVRKYCEKFKLNFVLLPVHIYRDRLNMLMTCVSW